MRKKDVISDIVPPTIQIKIHEFIKVISLGDIYTLLRYSIEYHSHFTFISTINLSDLLSVYFGTRKLTLKITKKRAR